MRRILLVLTFVFFLSGCTSSELDRALMIREQLQNGSGCEFVAEITADYSDVIYEFELFCKSDPLGNLEFTVISPETISGIRGKISDDGGALSFDDKLLAFELMADDQISPVSAPWILLKTLRGGYIRACSRSEDGLMLIIDDSYEDDSLQLDIWIDESNIPLSAEILWDGRRILSLKITNFTYL